MEKSYDGKSLDCINDPEQGWPNEKPEEQNGAIKQSKP